MEHDDNVGARGQGFAITGLLIAAITVVAVVLEDLQAEAARQVNGLVGAVVIHQNADIDQLGKFSDGGLERFLRVVGGHYDRDALAVDHGSKITAGNSMIPESAALAATMCISRDFTARAVHGLILSVAL